MSKNSDGHRWNGTERCISGQIRPEYETIRLFEVHDCNHRLPIDDWRLLFRYTETRTATGRRDPICRSWIGLRSALICRPHSSGCDKSMNCKSELFILFSMRSQEAKRSIFHWLNNHRLPLQLHCWIDSVNPQFYRLVSVGRKDQHAILPLLNQSKMRVVSNGEINGRIVGNKNLNILMRILLNKLFSYVFTNRQIGAHQWGKHLTRLKNDVHQSHTCSTKPRSVWFDQCRTFLMQNT